MDIEEARRIWKGSDMSESELIEWVRMVNQREKKMTNDKEHLGETIVICEQGPVK